MGQGFKFGERQDIYTTVPSTTDFPTGKKGFKPGENQEQGTIIQVNPDGTLVVPPADDDSAYVGKSTLTTDGDIFIRSGGAVTRLPIGSAAKVLTVSGGLPSWQTAGGGGTGPVSTGTSAAIIPGLAGSPDITPGGGSDDEFDTTNASAWTGWSVWTAAGGGPTAADENTTAKSHAYLKSTGTGTDIFAGYGKLAITDPSVTPYTVTAKCSDSMQYGTASFCCLVVSDTIDGSGKMVAFGTWSGRFRGTYSANNSYSTNLDTGDYVYTPPFYVRFVVHSPTNIDIMYSANGIIWKTHTAGLNYLANAKYIAIAQDHFVDVASVWDFVRFS